MNVEINESTENKKYTLILRAAWGANPPKAWKKLEEPVKFIIVHWTDTESCTTVEECSKTIKLLQEDHMLKKGYDDIAFNFLVAEDGNIYEGRGWGVLPLRQPNFDPIHGQCVSVGQIGRKGSRPTMKLVELVYSFISYGSETGHLTKYTGLYPVFD